MRRWRIEFVDWHGNVSVIRLCFTRWGAQRIARRLNQHRVNGAVYLRVEAEWQWAEW